MSKIVIGWNELPPYAEELIEAGIKATEESVAIVATRPRVPFKDSGERFGSALCWVDVDEKRSWSSLGLKTPEIFFQPSWVYPVFNSLGKEVKSAGGVVIGLFDNCWKGTVRQILGAVYFRFLLRYRFDSVWVPGESGRRLAAFWGFNDRQIYEGLYGISELRFTDLGSVLVREKYFCFVGQLIERKGFPELMQAFAQFRRNNKEWRLRIFGCGPLQYLARGDGVDYMGFQQSSTVTSHLERASFLILPSREDHWPLVVCEAAHAGCGLLVSDKVGNRFELVNDDNGIVFKSGCVDAIRASLSQAVCGRFGDSNFVSKVSRGLAKKYTPIEWGGRFKVICGRANYE